MVTSWRLIEANAVDLAFTRNQSTTFTLTDNRPDERAPQPPGFRLKLRPEQLRSLTWMIAQETSAAPWIEEEVAEAALPQLGWHAETKATREVKVKGGVLADQGTLFLHHYLLIDFECVSSIIVGYGKTAIIVGLICATRDKLVLPVYEDRIAVKADLIVVPAVSATLIP